MTTILRSTKNPEEYDDSWYKLPVLTPHYLKPLRIIAERQGSTAQEIAKLDGRSVNTLTSRLTVLVDRGSVYRAQRKTNNGYINLYYITEQGRKELTDGLQRTYNKRQSK